MKMSSRKSNYSSSSELLSSSKSLRISFVQSSKLPLYVPCNSHFNSHSQVPTLKHSSRWSIDFDANRDRKFKATLYERGSAIL